MGKMRELEGAERLLKLHSKWQREYQEQMSKWTKIVQAYEESKKGSDDSWEVQFPMEPLLKYSFPKPSLKQLHTEEQIRQEQRESIAKYTK